MTKATFRKTVWAFYKKEGRHTLPWRKTRNPYRILVSEVMLQQTQVERVLPYYQAFLSRFPTVHELSQAPLRDVLKVWQGLGYNRRARQLHEAAKAVVREYNGRFPKDLSVLPGVGPYTAGAVRVFAYNDDVVILETNIRTAITHHFFADRTDIPDKEVIAVVAKVLPKGEAREWYAALMDYGSHLKRSGVRINTKKKGYTKQSAFKGSNREARGAILKALVEGSKTRSALRTLYPLRTEHIDAQLTNLLRERLIEKKGSLYQLPD